MYFNPNESTAVLRVHSSNFNPRVTRIGCIIAKVLEVGGVDYSGKKVRAGTWVISSPDPLVKLFVGRSAFEGAEDAEQMSGHIVAVMPEGMPRGVSLTATIDTRGKGSKAGLTATPGVDYRERLRGVTIDESSFTYYRGSTDTWVGGADFSVPIRDDKLREGDETFEIILRPDPAHSGLVRYELVNEWTECGNGCVHRATIIDDDPMPAMDLSVSADAIMEEGETSSRAMVSITNGARFADDQMVTLALGGTATMGADYTVSPADADRAMPDYQVVLPARSASAEVTLKAMSDEVDDPGEKIEVSAALDGSAIGHMQSVEIMNHEIPLPKISLGANRETIIGSMEDLVLTLTREGSLSERLALTIEVEQDQHWLPWPSCPVAFAAGEGTTTVTVPHGVFSPDVVQSGNLTLRVKAADGYDTDGAEVTVHVVSQEGPAVRVFFDRNTYRFAENDGGATAMLIAEAAPGMPRGTTIAFSMFSQSGTAIADEDFKGVSRQVTLPEEDFSYQHGSWQVRRRMPVTLLDDDVREGDETCDLVLAAVRDAQADLGLRAVTPVDITDDEDVPEMNLRLSADEIAEKGETSATATVSITNGKVYATDQLVTFSLGGSATQGADYRVSPSDADRSAAGHQLNLSAGSNSVALTFTALDDGAQDPGEEISLAVDHEGHAIGNGSIRIRDRVPGPTVDITFEGVGASSDTKAQGVATGPFTTRLVFSEPVRGFEAEDLDWQTLAGSTEDGTSIGIFLWDFTEVRKGVEYTVEMMPTQNGVVHIVVWDGSVTSVATDAGNQWGLGALGVKFPRDRLLVAPADLVVHEGGASREVAIVLTSEPTGDVTVKVSGMAGTAVSVDQPEIRIERKFWTTGRAVKVSAGKDVNAVNETVTLKVDARGGGYEGRSAKAVVHVMDKSVEQCWRRCGRRG